MTLYTFYHSPKKTTKVEGCCLPRSFAKPSVHLTLKKYIELFNRHFFQANSRDYEIIVGDKDNVIDHNLITRAAVGRGKKFIVVKGGHHMPLSDEVKNIIKSIISSAD